MTLPRTENMDNQDELQKSTEVHQLSSFFSPDRTYLTMHINGDICEETLNPVIDNIILANMHTGNQVSEEDATGYENIGHINLFINSPGGDMTPTLQLLTAIDSSKIPVRVIAWADCASAAFMILMAGHERLVSPHTILMSHNVSVMIGGEKMKIHTEDKSFALMNQAMSERAFELYRNYLGKDRAWIKRNLLRTDKQDVYLTAERAIEWGIADHYFTDFDILKSVPEEQ